MCFSAQADLVGGLVVGAIAIDAIRHVEVRNEQAALAAIPVILAVHQIDEAFVWWGLQGHVSATVGNVATWIYLLIAFVLLPVFFPVAVLLVEPPGRRRLLMVPFVAMGTVVAGILLASMLRGPVTAELGHLHIAYDIGLSAGGAIVAAYVVATCGAAVFSGIRPIAIFGIVNLVGVALFARLTLDGFVSLWCAWAAVASAMIALHLRRTSTGTTPVAVLPPRQVGAPRST